MSLILSPQLSKGFDENCRLGKEAANKYGGLLRHNSGIVRRIDPKQCEKVHQGRNLGNKHFPFLGPQTYIAKPQLQTLNLTLLPRRRLQLPPTICASREAISSSRHGTSKAQVTKPEMHTEVPPQLYIYIYMFVCTYTASTSDLQFYGAAKAWSIQL